MDAKELLKQKGEWIAVGASGAILLGYAVMAFGMPDTTDLDAVKGSTTAAASALDNNPAPAVTKKDFAPLTKAWAPDSVTKPEGKGEYVAMFRSEVVPKVIKKAGGKDPVKPVEVPKTLMNPVIEPAETELGQVTLKWKEGKKAGVVAAPILEFHIWRQESGKEWALLTKVPGVKKTYVDQSVEPKKKYAYKVRATTKPDKLLTDGKTESEFTATVEATIPSGTNIIYKGGSKQAANIIVKKFMGGAWKEKQFVVWPKNEEPGKEKTGEIGGKARERNPETNKMEDVDYSTGFVLIEIKTDRFSDKRIERRSHIDEATKELVSEDVEVPFERDRLKIRYLNDEGKEQEMWAHDSKDEEGGDPK